jgi:ABC-type nitrate/sulfonate/bicarbonate transport system permease component
MMSMQHDHSREPHIVSPAGSVIAPVNIDWIGFASDLIPIAIVGAAYSVSAQFLPFGSGPASTAGVLGHLVYSLSIACGGALAGLIAGSILAFAMGSSSEQGSDQRFLFFTCFPLLPVLSLLGSLWFGMDSSTGGLLLGAIFAAAAVTAVMLPAARDDSRRSPAFVDAAVLALLCALGVEITREAFGGAMGLGALATKAMFTFDMPSTFLVLFILAIISSALAMLRRAARLYLSRLAN